MKDLLKIPNLKSVLFWFIGLSLVTPQIFSAINNTFENETLKPVIFRIFVAVYIIVPIIILAVYFILQSKPKKREIKNNKSTPIITIAAILSLSSISIWALNFNNVKNYSIKEEIKYESAKYIFEYGPYDCKINNLFNILNDFEYQDSVANVIQREIIHTKLKLANYKASELSNKNASIKNFIKDSCEDKYYSSLYQHYKFLNDSSMSKKSLGLTDSIVKTKNAVYEINELTNIIRNQLEVKQKDYKLYVENLFLLYMKKVNKLFLLETIIILLILLSIYIRSKGISEDYKKAIKIGIDIYVLMFIQLITGLASESKSIDINHKGFLYTSSSWYAPNFLYSVISGSNVNNINKSRNSYIYQSELDSTLLLSKFDTIKNSLAEINESIKKSSTNSTNTDIGTYLTELNYVLESINSSITTGLSNHKQLDTLNKNIEQINKEIGHLKKQTLSYIEQYREDSGIKNN
nr:hypothetical protein [uncultured Carboxylicivirga sp.]